MLGIGKSIDKWLEFVFVLILVYLVLNNAAGFSMALGSLGSVQTQAIKALQGR